jgi:hypothetical protein
MSADVKDERCRIHKHAAEGDGSVAWHWVVYVSLTVCHWVRYGTLSLFLISASRFYIGNYKYGGPGTCYYW